MLRVGVHFEEVSPAAQAALDRWVFELMRAQATTWRHLRGDLYRREPGAGAERRGGVRVPAGPAKYKLRLQRPDDGQLLPLAAQARLVANPNARWARPRALQLWDISATGCAYLCAEADAPPTGTILDLLLVGEGTSAPVRGRVVYSLPTRA